ncbi:MAG: hypothetical protein DLM68_09180 [Hyphomicrobiales bacterium]|nr:MAG: hypothetical protein DLM68_09180 [Hyphomicrobiales bacterium]
MFSKVRRTATVHCLPTCELTVLARYDFGPLAADFGCWPKQFASRRKNGRNRCALVSITIVRTAVELSRRSSARLGLPMSRRARAHCTHAAASRFPRRENHGQGFRRATPPGRVCPPFQVRDR